MSEELLRELLAGLELLGLPCWPLPGEAIVPRCVYASLPVLLALLIGQWVPLAAFTVRFCGSSGGMKGPSWLVSCHID